MGLLAKPVAGWLNETKTPCADDFQGYDKPAVMIKVPVLCIQLLLEQGAVDTTLQSCHKP